MPHKTFVNVSIAQLRELWTDAFRAGRSARYARSLGMYDACPYPAGGLPADQLAESLHRLAGER